MKKMGRHFLKPAVSLLLAAMLVLSGLSDTNGVFSQRLYVHAEENSGDGAGSDETGGTTEGDETLPGGEETPGASKTPGGEETPGASETPGSGEMTGSGETPGDDTAGGTTVGGATSGTGDDVTVGEGGTPGEDGSASEEKGEGTEGTEGTTSEDTSISSILKTAQIGTNYTVKGTVIFVDGKNVYIQDDTAGIDLYLKKADANITVGKKIEATGSYKVFNELRELEVAEGAYTVTDGDGTLPLKTVTIAGLLQDDAAGKSLQSTRIFLDKAVLGTVNPSGNTELIQKDGDTEYKINAYKMTLPEGIEEGDTISVNAIVSIYKTIQLRIPSVADVTLIEKKKDEGESGEGGATTPTGFAEKVATLEDGNVVALYSVSGKCVLTAEADSAKLKGEEAIFTDEKLGVTETLAKLTVIKGDDGYFRFKNDGKYLTSKETGNGVSFADGETPYALWEMKPTPTEGVVTLKNVNAAYNGKEQSLEYYNGFTTFGTQDNDKYQFVFYLIEKGSPTVQVDESISSAIASMAGGAYTAEEYEKVTASKIVYGDRDSEGDGLDDKVKFTVIRDGQVAVPATSNTTSGATTKHYMGTTGLGFTSNDYMQMEMSTAKFGNLHLQFRMYGSDTTPGEYTLQYSQDGVNFANVGNVDFKYEYTDYSQSTPTPVKKEGTNPNGLVKMSRGSTYITFDVDLPAETVNLYNLTLRLVPGTTAIKSGKTIGKTGNVRLENVVVTGSPIVSGDICKPVAAAPLSGEVVLNQVLTLTSGTEGADIFYDINGAGFVKYDPASMPVLSELPATVKTYAGKDGVESSVTMTYKYTQSKVATVTASPKGGAVVKGISVLFRCATEGATIYVSKDKGATWEEAVDGRVTLTELPVDYQVKATKADYLDSEPVTVSFTERQNEKYGIFFGQLHSHTNYSDGQGTCEEAFAHASSAVSNLDFLAVTDHSNSLDNADAASIKENVAGEWTDGHALADKYTVDGEFVGIYGYEMTWSNGLGHMNTFNTPGFQSRTQKEYSSYNTALANYYAALKTVPDSISQFNHPGSTFGDFMDFAYYSEEMDNLITVLEVGNGEGGVGTSGYFPSYDYYQRALDKGWHVAPTNNQDNHKGFWGDANTTRSVVLADSLTRANIYDALKSYRVYATEDNDLRIYYTLDNFIMGTILDEGATGATVTAKVELSDATDAVVGKVSVVTNGGLVLDSKRVEANEGSLTFEIPNNYSYYYIRVEQEDGDKAVTAPVWVRPVEAVGINSFTTTETLPVAGEAIDLGLELYNNEKRDLDLTSITFTVGEDVIEEVDLTANDLTKVAAQTTKTYSFKYLNDKVGNLVMTATVKGTLNGVEKLYTSNLKLAYMPSEMITPVIVDGTHFNDYVTGYYGGNMGNFTKLAAEKNLKVRVETNQITPEMLKTCKLLVISAPARKSDTSNTGPYTPSHFDDAFLQMVKAYVDGGGTLMVCGLADYQDTTSGQSSTEINKLLETIGATTRINSDEAYDEVNNGGQAFRLYMTNYDKTSRYLTGAQDGQKYSAYSGCTVRLDPAAVAAGTATALVRGFDTTYSIDCKTDAGETISTKPAPVVVPKGEVVAIAHETLTNGANIFVAGTVCVSDFEIKAEMDNAADLPYLNRTITENILAEVKNETPITNIADVRRNGKPGEIFAVEGYVTSGTAVAGNIFFDTIYVQDDTAGITIFPYAKSGLAVGTKVRIIGYVDAYQGDKELQIMSAEILKDAPKVIAPEKMTAKDAMDYELSGGKLVQVEGKVKKLLRDSSGNGLAQLWLDDGSGELANVFIDGYILSAQTGKNELAGNIKEGDTVSAVGLVYMHPEGQVNVTCLRVRNVDEVVKAAAGGQGGGNTPGQGGGQGGGGNTPGGQGGGNTPGGTGAGNTPGQGGTIGGQAPGGAGDPAAAGAAAAGFGMAGAQAGIGQANAGGGNGPAVLPARRPGEDQTDNSAATSSKSTNDNKANAGNASQGAGDGDHQDGVSSGAGNSAEAGASIASGAEQGTNAQQSGAVKASGSLAPQIMIIIVILLALAAIIYIVAKSKKEDR